MKNRRSRLVDIASGKGFNAVAAFQPENAFYLTNFWGEAIAICCNDSTKLIVPKLEASRAEQDSKDCDIIFSDRGFQLIDARAKFMRYLRLPKLSMNYTKYALMKSKLDSQSVLCRLSLYLKLCRWMPKLHVINQL